MPDKIDSREVKERLGDNDIVMVSVSRDDYSRKTMEVVKAIAEQNECICYVSANKPEKTIVNSLKENDIDPKEFLVIDCVTGDTPRQEKNGIGTVFVNSPGNLMELNLAITDALNRGIETVFVDALSTFVIYGEGLVVVRFVHNLICKLRSVGKKGVFIVLRDDISKVLLDDLCMFVDEVIEIGG